VKQGQDSHPESLTDHRPRHSPINPDCLFGVLFLSLFKTLKFQTFFENVAEINGVGYDNLISRKLVPTLPIARLPTPMGHGKDHYTRIIDLINEVKWEPSHDDPAESSPIKRPELWRRPNKLKSPVNFSIKFFGNVRVSHEIPGKSLSKFCRCLRMEAKFRQRH
jgi:hypothetical protein